jgi:hypothetical protein
MQTVLLCSYCNYYTQSDFAGIHICSKAPGISELPPCQVCPTLGCPDHMFEPDQFLEIEEVLSHAGKCESCLTDLLRVRLPAQEWIYDIDPQLYDWFIQILQQYKWDTITIGNQNIYTCIGRKSSSSGKADKETWDPHLYDSGCLITTLLHRDQFGSVENTVLTYLEARDEGLMSDIYEWIDSMAGKGVAFIKAMCQAYGPGLDLRRYKLGTLFCITCLNGYCETARWLASEYRENIKIEGIRVDQMHWHNVQLAPKKLFGKDYQLEINDSCDLLDYVLKCSFNKTTLVEVLDLLKKYFPDAFIKLETPSAENVIYTDQSNQISLLLYTFGQSEKRKYSLSFAARSTYGIDLIGYCTDTKNHLGEKWLSKYHWYGLGYEVKHSYEQKSFLPSDMETGYLVIPWKRAGLTVYYGNAKTSDCNTYIVVARGEIPIYTYREGYCSLQLGDAGTEVCITDNHMLIDNWGDVESQVLITYNAQA